MPSDEPLDPQGQQGPPDPQGQQNPHDPQGQQAPQLSQGAQAQHGAAATPEYLGADKADASGSGRRGLLIAAGAVSVVAVAAAGSWAAVSLLASGSQPSEAVPAGTVGYVSLDLDPSASQKVEAFKMLKKFPALDEELGLDAKDDLRTLIFEESGLEDCKGISYADDVKPWIGDRAAFGLVPGVTDEDEPVPFVALQATDEKAAAAGLDAIAECEAVGGELGYAFSGDYVLLAEDTERAEAVAAAAEKGTLAQDKTFQKWTASVGDAGIMTMYASPKAPEVFAQLQEQVMEAAPGGMLGQAPGMEGPTEQLDKLAADFEGMAAVVRFEDGTVEAEIAGQGMPKGIDATGVTSAAEDLPASTGLALSMGVPDGWADQLVEQLATLSGESEAEIVAQAEQELGLTLPEDLESLLGKGVSITVDAEQDLLDALENEDITSVPVGIRVEGDPDKVTAVVDDLKAAMGPDAEMLVTASSGDSVAFGVSQEYVDQLVEDGKLGDVTAFKTVVPEADRATMVMYVDFNAGDGWLEKAADQMSSSIEGGEPDPEIRANLAPLGALGISSWTDGDVQRGLLRLSTD